MTDGAAPLRIGLLLDGPSIPWWIVPALSDLQHRNLIRIVVAAERAPDPPGERLSRPARWWRHRAVLGYALMHRIDRRRHPPGPEERDIPLAELCPTAEIMVVTPQSTRLSDTILPPDVDRLRGYQLDLMLRLGFRILRGPVLGAARDGVWSFHHGDNRTNRGGPEGVWEVLEDRLESGITLQRLTEELDGGEVLAWSVSGTQRFAPVRNARDLLRRSSRMLTRSVERMHRGADPCQVPSFERERWSGYDRPLYRTPTNKVLGAALLGLAGRYLRQRIRNAGKTLQWSLAWHWRDAPDAEDPHGVLHRYREIPTPKDRYWADPFVVQDGSRWWMFFEELRYASGRGEIAVWEMGPKGPIGAPRLILERPYHLSYPQVFQYQGRWYMLPETEAAGRVELYVAEEFPHQWSLHSTLMDGARIVDATLLEHEDHWYLFASEGTDEIEPGEELSAFVGPTPLGPFTRHPANPLVTDVRRARMAGRFFHSGNALFRPAQRCVPRYGAGIVVHEVLELTPDRYQERVTHELHPRWSRGMVGFHTINCSAGLSVIDSLRLARL